MKLTSQEEYGLRCILTLAGEEISRSGGEGQPMEAKSLTIHEIAAKEGLSAQYAGKLIRILAKAGLVESVRGCKGGFWLTRPGDKISVAEALAALGGKIYEAGTCERYKGDRRFCVHTKNCSLRSLWAGLQAMIDTVLSRTTLRDLLSTEKTMGELIKTHVQAMDAFQDAGAEPKETNITELSSSSSSSSSNSSTVCGPRR
jgi:Rrf2 family protein